MSLGPIRMFVYHSFEIGLLFLLLGAITSIIWFILHKMKKPVSVVKIESMVFLVIAVFCFMLNPIYKLIEEIKWKSDNSRTYTQNEDNLNLFSKSSSVLVPVETIIANSRETISPSSGIYYTVSLEKGGNLQFSYETETSQQIECAILTSINEVEKFRGGKASDAVGDIRSFVPGTYNLGTSFSVEKELDAGVYYVYFRNRNWFNDAYVNIKISKVTEELR